MQNYQSYLSEMNEELQKTFPGWMISFSGDHFRRMALVNKANFGEIVTVPFPDDASMRGENVYRALFAVLMEMARKKYLVTAEA